MTDKRSTKAMRCCNCHFYCDYPGQVELTSVFCPLCGDKMIAPISTNSNETDFRTSGNRLRSNLFSATVLLQISIAVAALVFVLKYTVKNDATNDSLSVEMAKTTETPPKRVSPSLIRQPDPLPGIPHGMLPEPAVADVFPRVAGLAEPKTTLLKTIAPKPVQAEPKQRGIVFQEPRTKNSVRLNEKTVSETPTPSVGPPLPQAALAEQLLESAQKSLGVDTEKCLREALQAVHLYRELGRETDHAIPAVAYWTISRAYASLNWGLPFLRHTPPIERMVVSSDSRWLLTQRFDNTLWLWDLKSDIDNREGFLIDTSQSRFVDIMFTPDFRWVIGATNDGAIRFWNMTAPQPAETAVTLPGAVPELRKIQLSPDGRWLAAFGSAQPLISNSQSQSQVPPIQDQIVSLFLSSPASLPSPLPPDRLYPEGSNSIQITPLPGIPKLPRFDQRLTPRRNEHGFPHENSVKEEIVRHLKQVNYLTSVPTSGQNAVWLWEIRQLTLGTVPSPIRLRGLEKPISSLCFSSDGHRLAVGSEDSTVRIYYLYDNSFDTEPIVMQGHGNAVTTLCFSSSGHWIASGDAAGKLHLRNLLDISADQVPIVLEGHEGRITDLSFGSRTSDGEILFSTGEDRTIRIWRITENSAENPTKNQVLESISVLQSHRNEITKMVSDANGQRLVCLEGNSGLQIYGLGGLDGEIDPRHSLTLRNRTLPITEMLVTPDGRYIVFAYTNLQEPSQSGVRLWPLELDELLKTVVK